MQALAHYWATEYDWRKVEARLNALPNFITNIDGLDIHFIHVRSKHENALPMIVTHGWPGSIIEQLKVIDPLTDPTGNRDYPDRFRACRRSSRWWLCCQHGSARRKRHWFCGVGGCNRRQMDGDAKRDRAPGQPCWIYLTSRNTCKRRSVAGGRGWLAVKRQAD